MNPFGIELLLSPALLILLATIVVAYWATRWPAFSILAGLTKSGIYVFYFGWAFDGTHTFYDDLQYLLGGGELLRDGVGISNLVENWDVALAIGGGIHFLYYLHNSYAFRIFGDGYYAPVALNILLTLPIALIGSHLAAKEFGLRFYRKKVFFVFLLFHPELLAWSHVVNGKDIVVLFLHILLLSAASAYFAGRIKLAVATAAPTCMALMFLRFYVPLLVAAAFLIAASNSWRSKQGLINSLVGVTLVVILIAIIGGAYIEDAGGRVQEHLVNPAFGLVRALLTPIPFHTEQAYSFLNVPALIHWMLLPFMLLGIVAAYRYGTPFARFLIWYFFVFVTLYAIYGELQGPRHRVQLGYAVALFQFLGLGILVRSMYADQACKRSGEGGAALSSEKRVFS